MTKGNDRDCVPRPIPFDLQSRYCAAGIEDALASGTAPRFFRVLAVQLTEFVRWFDLQSADFFCLSDLQSAYQTAFADFLCFIIRNRRCSLTFLSGFTSREYHVIRVDFIVALRRTKG